MHCWSSMCMWFLGDDSKLLFSAWTEGKVCVFPFLSSSLPCQPSAWLSMLVNGERQENRGNVKKMPGTNNSNNEKLSTLTHTPSVEDFSFILHFRANYVLAAYNSHALILLCNLWSFLYIHTHIRAHASYISTYSKLPWQSCKRAQFNKIFWHGMWVTGEKGLSAYHHEKPKAAILICMS